jgi:hypothetical protein
MRWLRQLLSVLVVTIMAGVGGVLLAPVASAEPFMPVHQDVYATTRIAKTGMTMTAPKGTFDGQVDLATGDLTGNMNIPPSSTTLTLLGAVPLATITFAMEPTGPVTGHVDFATLQSTSTSTFNIRLTKVSPPGADDVNLVGDECKTSTPISITMSGPAAVTTSSTVSGTFTIPEFEACQALTPMINALIPGPGNTFTATFGPAGTPPPPAPPAPGPLTPGIQNAGLNVQAGDQTFGTPPQSTGVPLPVPAPAEDATLLGWLLQAR